MTKRNSNPEKELLDLVEQIKAKGILWCPTCKAFTSFLNFQFYGKDSKEQKIHHKNMSKLQEFEGYSYICKKCGLRIDSEKNLGEINP